MSQLKKKKDDSSAEQKADKRYFECTADGSDKFWEIETADSCFTVRFGRTGTGGQTKTTECGSEAEARKEAEKLVTAKIKKGYIEMTGEKAPIRERSILDGINKKHWQKLASIEKDIIAAVTSAIKDIFKGKLQPDYEGGYGCQDIFNENILKNLILYVSDDNLEVLYINGKLKNGWSDKNPGWMFPVFDRIKTDLYMWKENILEDNYDDDDDLADAMVPLVDHFYYYIAAKIEKLLREKNKVKLDKDFSVYYQFHDDEGPVKDSLRRKAAESTDMSAVDFLKMMIK